VKSASADTLAGIDACAGCGLTFPVIDGVLCLGQPAGSQDDYPDTLYPLISEAETNHFWFVARNDIIQSVMKQRIGPLTGLQLLDVGCGTGFVLHSLEQAGVIAWGVDMHFAALAMARTRVKGPLVWTQAEQLPFGDDFDAVSLFDVIEHAPDDTFLVREAARVVQPGGSVIITVPAGPHLWTHYDAVIGHKRRYTREAVTSLFNRVGLQINTVQYFNCLPAILQRSHRWVSGVDSSKLSRNEVVRRALSVPPAPLNALLRRFVPLEAPLGRLPFVTGASLIAVGRRAN
jgi:ubiquinone/menaquinone biosynthesis C-methylase UbiE